MTGPARPDDCSVLTSRFRKRHFRCHVSPAFHGASTCRRSVAGSPLRRVIHLTGEGPMMHPIRLTAVILGLAAATGCASSKTAAQAGASHRSTGDVLGGEELSGTGATNVYDAVQRLRPQWLTSARIRRGGSGDELVVYLDSN